MESLQDSEEEEDGEHISLVMSSFFSDDDEDDDAKDKGTATIALATKDVALPVADVAKLKSPKVQEVPPAVTPSAIIVAEEETDSTKPTMAEDKGKGPANIEEAKTNKVIEDDTTLDEGSFDQELGGRIYRFHQAVGKTMGDK